MASPEYLGRSPAPFLFYGAVGVPMFFVISGFIIAAVSLDRNLHPDITVQEFYRRRFIRIIPFMWLCTIGYTILRLAGTGAFEWGPFLRAMSLWPIGDVRPNVVWTLRHEFLFYILFACAMLAGVRRQALLVLWFASPFLLWALQRTAPEMLAPLPPDIQALLSFLCNVVNVPFGAGFVFGIMYARGDHLCKPRFGGGFPLILAATAAGFGLLAWWGPSWNDFWVSVTVSVASALLVWFGIGLRPDAGRMSRFGHHLGDASYSIYLVHTPILLILLSLTTKLHVANHIWVIYAAMVACAVTGGWVVHCIIERPLIRLVNKIIRKRPERVSVRGVAPSR